MADVLRPPYAVRIWLRSSGAAIGAQGAANRLALTSVQVAAPFAQIDWPNPNRRLYPVALRTFTNPFPINLYGKDQFFAAPGMGPDYDYPNPRIRRVQQPQLAGRTLDPQAPFNGGVLDNPRRPIRTLVGQDQASPIALTASPPAAAPFAPEDFQNPQVRRARPLFELSISLALLQDAGAAEGPFNQWMNPLFRRVAQPQLNPSPLALLAQPAPPAPITAQDWPNPRLRAVQQQQSLPTLLTTLAANPSVLSAMDMPVRLPVPRQGFSQSPFAAFIVIPPKPFLQADWPNPTRRPTFIFTDPWLAQLPPSEIPIPPEPPVIPIWTRVPTNPESWSTIGANSETWTRVPTNPETWTPE